MSTETRSYDFRPLGPRIVVTIHYEQLGAMLAGRLNRPSRRGKNKSAPPKRVSIMQGAISAKRSEL